MEYISAEEFLKQSTKVQKVFLDWWKPQENEIFMDKADSTIVECIFYKSTNNEIYYTHRDNMSEKDTMIPLFTEGQIRKFIEEKTDSKLETMYIDGYSIRLSRNNPEGKNVIFSKRFLEKDLLRSYWKVAIEIAKECIE